MTLKELGWNDQLESSFEALAQRGLSPARIAREDRDLYVAYSPGRALRAVIRGQLRLHATSRGDLPVVGDWVALRAPDACQLESRAVIVEILPRRSAITRKAAGSGNCEQFVASNVDLMLICCGLDRDFNPRRVERYLTLAHGSGTSPIIALTKSDTCEDFRARVAQTQAIASGAPVIALGFDSDSGVQAVRAAIRPGLTAALVGSSGAGKSTLINRLLRRDELRIGAVRADDQRGRHTTTWRQLLLLPGAGVVIDTPGLREIQLWSDSADVASSFCEVEEIAQRCRFSNCTHGNEPGCAIRVALAEGRLDEGRWESFCKQERELRYQERRGNRAVEAAEKARWKALHKSARKWMKDKYRY